MAASRLLLARPELGSRIHIFEKRKALGRKLLIAGSSGLNISHNLPVSEFAHVYEGFTEAYWEEVLHNFGIKEWLEFISNELKLETFLGTSERYFVREMKASLLLKRWTEWLKEKSVRFHTESELTDFESNGCDVSLRFTHFTTGENKVLNFSKVVLALGGASWETETPAWSKLFLKKEIPMIPFLPSNVGYEVDWSEKFLQEAEGKPLKKICLKSPRGEKMGELVVTRYGLEGTPIYFCGMPGPVFLDLMPDLTEAEIERRLSRVKENLSPFRRVKHLLKLSDAAQSLLFHHSEPQVKSDLRALIHQIKHFPLVLKQARPLSEAISSKGGVDLCVLERSFALKSLPQIFCIGEMLAWDAPTGGFLIQAAVSQGAWVGDHLANSCQ